MDDFLSRLTHIIGDKKPFAWAAGVGINKATFSRIWNEGVPPKANHLAAIAQSTGISIDWLLTGEGPMHRGQATAMSANEGTAAYGLTEEEATLLEIYNDLSDDYKDELITSLKALIDLDQDSKKKRVGLLEKLRKGAS